MSVPPIGHSQIDLVEQLCALSDPAERRSARLGLKEEALLLRLQARKFLAVSRLADAVAKFGGGSLFTATLLLIVGGKAGAATLATGTLGLLLFLVGTSFWVYCDLQASRRDIGADRLDAVLNEAEH